VGFEFGFLQSLSTILALEPNHGAARHSEVGSQLENYLGFKVGESPGVVPCLWGRRVFLGWCTARRGHATLGRERREEKKKERWRANLVLVSQFGLLLEHLYQKAS